MMKTCLMLAKFSKLLELFSLLRPHIMQERDELVEQEEKDTISRATARNDEKET